MAHPYKPCDSCLYDVRPHTEQEQFHLSQQLEVPDSGPSYDKAHPVEVPSIFITDASIVSGEIKYIGTKTKTRDGSVFAETTYQINWPETVVTYQQFDVRWSFKDIQYSKDFQAEKGQAVEGSEE